MDETHFVHPFICRFLGRPHPLASVNSAAVNMDIYVSPQVPAFDAFGYLLRSGIAESYNNFIFNFKDLPYSFL